MGRMCVRHPPVRVRASRSSIRTHNHTSPARRDTPLRPPRAARSVATRLAAMAAARAPAPDAGNVTQFVSETLLRLVAHVGSVPRDTPIHDEALAVIATGQIIDHELAAHGVRAGGRRAPA